MQHLLLLLMLISPITGIPVLTSTPATFLPGVTAQLDLRCSLPNRGTDVNRVLVIQIEKVNSLHLQPLASMTTGENPKLDTQFLNQWALVTGFISSNAPSDSYLQLTLKNPGAEDSGTYRCTMSVLDKALLLVRMDTNVNVSTNNGTMVPDVVLQELRTLQHQVTALSHELANRPAIACEPKPTVPTAVPTIAFTARPAERRTFHLGKLLFDMVDLNIGGAYDSAQSTFTAPVNGTYVMMASISCDDFRTGTELKVNNETKAQLPTQALDQSSVSLVLQLEQGDRVWLDGVYFNTAPILYADKDTLFSGFLLSQP